MSATPYMQLLKDARAQGRDTNIPPIAVSVTLLDGYDVNDDRTLFEPSLLLTPVPHPVLEAILETSGATRRGLMSWVVGLGEDYNHAPLAQLRTRLYSGTLMAEVQASNTRGPRSLDRLYAGDLSHGLNNELTGTPAYLGLDHNDPIVRMGYPKTGPARFGAVTVSATNQVMWIKVITHKFEVPEYLPEIPLNLRPGGKARIEPKPVRPIDAVPVLDWLASEGITLVDGSGENALGVIRRRVSQSLIAVPQRGRPALADVSVGRGLFRLPGLSLPAEQPYGSQSASRTTLTALRVAALTRQLPADVAVIHPGVADTGAMALAEPVEDDRLRRYQSEAVGLHLSTKFGFANTSGPGLGKTVMTYAALARKAEQVPKYRGLVVAEANVRTQWVNEGAEWFPDADIVTVESRSDAARLEQALSGDGPVVAVLSYGLLAAITEEQARRASAAQALSEVPTAGPACGAAAAAVVEMLPPGFEPLESPFGQLDLFSEFVTADSQAEEAEPETPDVTLGALLLDTYWEDLIADEAEVLRGTGSRQVAALWELRRRSGVAVVLTGTPINRGLDDLGRLISWVRNDEHLFHGVRLSTQFNLDDDCELEEFLEALGPLVFRRDSSEIEDELPTVRPVVMKLTPSPEEKALAGAARDELKRVYLELMSWLDMVEQSDPDNPQYAQARESLKAARGAWLGGTTLARMASSDPAALLGSQSAGAALLAGQGLIEAATAQAGTKRTAVVGYAAEKVAAGKRVLIFTEFATVAHGLIEDLDAAGVRVGSVLGGGGRRRDQMIAQFQQGQLDVLVCTSSGERGLNLQQANVIVHYDLPWTPKAVIQRTGRGRRIGSVNKELELLFPLMEGTIEERVASMVVSRAVEAMRALDASRGVDTSRTEMGLALGGLVAAVNQPSARTEGSALLAMTEALVA